MSALTLSAPPVAPADALAPLPEYLGRLRPFTVAEYHRMIEIGLFGPEERCELIDGHVVTKMPQNTPHTFGIRRLNRHLMRTVEPDWTVQCQLPIQLADSEPEPDFSILVAAADDYRGRKPTPADIVAVVEVAHSSLPFDRGTKLRVYGQACIPVYWIVDVDNRQVEVFADPANGVYQRHDVHAEGDVIDLVLDGQTATRIAVADLLE